MGPGLFFYADVQFGAGLLDHLARVGFREFLEFVIPLDGLLSGWDFILGDVATAVLPVLPGVEIIIRAVGALADDRERPVLHLLNLEDLVEE